MAEFKVGYFVGSLSSKSINRLLAKALVRVAPQELQLTEIPFGICRSIATTTKELPAGREGIQGRHSRGGCGAVRDARVQPVNPGWAEECDRLGEPAVRQERVRPEAVGRHRNVAGQDRHGGGAAASPQHAGVLQLATDECDRSVHPVRGRLITMLARSQTSPTKSSSRTTWRSSTGSLPECTQCCREMPRVRMGLVSGPCPVVTVHMT